MQAALQYSKLFPESERMAFWRRFAHRSSSEAGDSENQATVVDVNNPQSWEHSDVIRTDDDSLRVRVSSVPGGTIVVNLRCKKRDRSRECLHILQAVNHSYGCRRRRGRDG
jgi:hypothetical protein